MRVCTVAKGHSWPEAKLKGLYCTHPDATGEGGFWEQLNTTRPTTLPLPPFPPPPPPPPPPLQAKSIGWTHFALICASRSPHLRNQNRNQRWDSCCTRTGKLKGRAEKGWRERRVETKIRTQCVHILLGNMKVINNNGDRTERSPIWSVIIRVITKLDDREAGVQFVNHEYDYRPNRTTRSPTTN